MKIELDILMNGEALGETMTYLADQQGSRSSGGAVEVIWKSAYSNILNYSDRKQGFQIYLPGREDDVDPD